MLRPWIRKYNYISDYFYTAYELYIKTYPAFPTNYYSIDRGETIWDNDLIFGGSYEKLGVGPLSGVKWKKIYMLPVFGLEQISPTHESSDLGLTTKESMATSFNIPQIYDLKPNEGDVIDINFGFKSEDIYTRALYVVTNVNLAHHGDYLNIFKCEVRIAPFDKTEIENQISTHWQFYELEKKIIPYDNAVVLNKLAIRLENNVNNLIDMFDYKINYFLEDNDS